MLTLNRNCQNRIKINTSLQTRRTTHISGSRQWHTRAISSAAFSRLSSSRLTCAACSSELSIYQHTTNEQMLQWQRCAYNSWMTSNLHNFRPALSHFLHHHYHHPVLFLSSTTDSKLIFSTNPFLHSSFKFHPTDWLHGFQLFIWFSRACRFQLR